MTASATPKSETLLHVRELATEFRGDDETVRAVDHVSFDVLRGEMLGIVGESGSGKSATSLSIMRLLPPQGRVTDGVVELAGTNLLSLTEARMRELRGSRVAMIFQDPMTALNPYLRVGEQLVEGAVLHLGLSASDAERRAAALLDRVRIPDARARLRSYPHELSGGMRQRVMIAMALLCDPDLVIADEPTTALDVTVQAQILELLSELRRERGLSIVLVTHDLGVVAQVADEVAVMYAGRIVERGSVAQVLGSPRHPYTWGLLRSTPRLEGATQALEPIAGRPPSLVRPPTGCRFHPRCPHATPEHARIDPALGALPGEPGHAAACLLEPELRARLWSEMNETHA